MKHMFGLALLLLACNSFVFSQTSRIDFRFDFIRHQAEATNQLADPIPATIRFENHPDGALLDRLEQMESASSTSMAPGWRPGPCIRSG